MRRRHTLQRYLAGGLALVPPLPLLAVRSAPFRRLAVVVRGVEAIAAEVAKRLMA